MDDRFQHLIADEAPTCKFPVDADLCGEYGPYKTEELEYAGERGRLRLCKTHMRQTDANLRALLSHMIPSQVSGIESTPPTPPQPAIQAVQIQVHEAYDPAPALPNAMPTRQAIEYPREEPAPAERREGDLVLPPGFDPADPRALSGSHHFCATEVGDGKVCGTWFARGGEAQEAKKHGIPGYRLLLLPEGPIRCERPDHIAAGCRRTFTSFAGRSSHYGSTQIYPLTPAQQPAIEAFPYPRSSLDDVRMTAGHRL